MVYAIKSNSKCALHIVGGTGKNLFSKKDFKIESKNLPLAFLSGKWPIKVILKCLKNQIIAARSPKEVAYKTPQKKM